MRDMQKRWLVFRLSALGDVVLTTGVLAHWSAMRDWRFHVLTKQAFAPVFEGNPVVDAVIAAGEDDLRMPRLVPWFRELALEYKGWGLIDLHGVLRSRLLGALWRGPVLRYPKHAMARRLFLQSGGRLCRSRLLAANVPQRYALAAGTAAPDAAALLPRLYLSDAELEWGRARAPKGCVALHPYAAHVHKAWPEGHWRELAAMLDARGIPWVLIGRGNRFFPGDARDFTDRSTLRESAALLAACSVLVTGDSGPMHLATAVGTPVVGLFGPTTREWGFFPSGPRDIVLEQDLPCRPCSLHGKKPCPDAGKCLALIRPEAVLDALTRLLLAEGPHSG